MWNLGKNGTDGPICKLEIRDTDLKIKKNLWTPKGDEGVRWIQRLGLFVNYYV